MATTQEVLTHMTGHTGGQPLQLSSQTHFTRAQRPPSGSSDARTSIFIQRTTSRAVPTAMGSTACPTSVSPYR